MLMSPNKSETAVHGCHCPGDISVHMRDCNGQAVGWCMVCVLFAFVSIYFLLIIIDIFFPFELYFQVD